MAGWTPIPVLINEEKKQLVEEGVVPEAAEGAAREATKRLEAGTNEADVWAVFANLPRRSDFAFDEPSDLAGIRAKRNGKGKRLPFSMSDDVLLDKMHGAWLGRCAGCALGKPIESFLYEHNGMLSWERQKRFLTAISPSEWPLRDYVPQHSPAETETGKTWCLPSTREQIAFMESDDDIRYTVLGQIIMKHHGRDFGSSHVASIWLDKLGYRQVCTAETQAYRNIVIAADRFRRDFTIDEAREYDANADWHWIVHHLNPYREWIGAQIRVDSYGYAAPGDPELAAEFAWRDARISHVKNGIYGAMFCAAMIAAAFATDDVTEIIEAGLAQIPTTSRLYAEMRQTIDICARHGNLFDNFEKVLKELYDLLNHYDPVHTNNNAAVCVMALLLSAGDFHRGITLAVMGGWDTDCNGATVGSIVGAICGGKRAPAHWTARLNDTLNSLIVEYHPVSIKKCAATSAAIARKVISQ